MKPGAKLFSLSIKMLTEEIFRQNDKVGGKHANTREHRDDEQGRADEWFAFLYDDSSYKLI